jgi:hypothetical protein
MSRQKISKVLGVVLSVTIMLMCLAGCGDVAEFTTSAVEQNVLNTFGGSYTEYNTGSKLEMSSTASDTFDVVAVYTDEAYNTYANALTAVVEYSDSMSGNKSNLTKNFQHTNYARYIVNDTCFFLGRAGNSYVGIQCSSNDKEKAIQVMKNLGF